MKFEKFLAILILVSLPVYADETPRPIFASSIYNGAGYLYIPTITPFGARACYFDESSTLAASVTTSTELSYLHGVTGPIQAQINSISSGRTTNTISSNFLVPTLGLDYILNVNTSSGALTVTLADAIASDTKCIDVKDIGPNSIMVLTQFGQTIDSVLSDSILQNTDTKKYCAVSGNWFKY